MCVCVCMCGAGPAGLTKGEEAAAVLSPGELVTPSPAHVSV